MSALLSHKAAPEIAATITKPACASWNPVAGGRLCKRYCDFQPPKNHLHMNLSELLRMNLPVSFFFAILAP